MYRDKNKNFDGLPLAADHTHARAYGGKKADRLLHFSCNSSRGQGDRDTTRPAALRSPTDIDVEGLSLDGIIVVE